MGGMSNLGFPSRRRSSLAISVAILKAARKGIKKTHLLCSVSLSYEQSIRYIEFLKTHGLIRECETLCQTTEKGLELIEEFDSSLLIRECCILET